MKVVTSCSHKAEILNIRFLMKHLKIESLLQDKAQGWCSNVSWPCCKNCKIMAKIGQEKQDRGGNCTNQSMVGRVSVSAGCSVAVSPAYGAR